MKINSTEYFPAWEKIHIKIIEAVNNINEIWLKPEDRKFIIKSLDTINKQIFYQVNPQNIASNLVDLCTFFISKNLDHLISHIVPLRQLFNIINIQKLPDDILKLILQKLKLQDALNLRATCTFFNTKILTLKNIKIINPPKIYAGYENFFIIEDDKAYSFGNNCFGQLGLGDTVDRKDPELITLPNANIPLSIAAGRRHTLILCADGNIYSFGNNGNGQLGIGSKGDSFRTPQLIKLPKDLKPIKIAAGADHSLILSNTGDVYIFGLHYSSSPQLAKLPDYHKAKDLAGGNSHSLILLENGKICSFGENNSNQLGLNHNRRQESPQLIDFQIEVKEIAVRSDDNLLLLENGCVYGFGARHLGVAYENTGNRSIALPINLKLNSYNKLKPIKISIGRFTTCFLNEQGELHYRSRESIHEYANFRCFALQNQKIKDIVAGYHRESHESQCLIITDKRQICLLTLSGYKQLLKLIELPKQELNASSNNTDNQKCIVGHSS